MFVTSHAMTAYILTRAATCDECMAIYAASGAAANDVLPFLAMNRNWAVYRWTHSFSWWQTLPVAVALVASLAGETGASLCLLSFVAGFVSHQLVDYMWHDKDGQWHSWGRSADLFLHCISFIVLVRWLWG